MESQLFQYNLYHCQLSQLPSPDDGLVRDAEEDAEESDDGSELDEDEYNDPENQEIIKTLLI